MKYIKLEIARLSSDQLQNNRVKLSLMEMSLEKLDTKSPIFMLKARKLADRK